jgi:hypothetical protein
VHCPPVAPIAKTVASASSDACFFNDLEDSLYNLFDEVLLEEILLDKALQLVELMLLE